MNSEHQSTQSRQLYAEQEATQHSKFQGRLLGDYTVSIFRGNAWKEPRSCPVTDFYVR